VRAARELEDALIEGRALSNLGMLDARLGDPQAALVRFRQARARYEVSEDATGEQHTLGQLGVVYAALGDPRRAIAVLDSALALAREHGLRQEEASDLELIGEFHREAGDHRRALEFYRQAGAINTELGLTIEAGVDLRNEAMIYAALGDAEHARSLAERALGTHRSVDADIEAHADLLVLAEMEAPARARLLLLQARTLTDRIDSRAARLDLAVTEARVASKAEDPRGTLAALDRASADLAGSSYHVVAQVEALRARSYSRLGSLDLALAAGRRALAAAERARASYGSGFLRTSFVHDQRAVYTDLVDILLAMGEVEDAFGVADAARGRALLEHLSALPPSGDSAEQAGTTASALRRGEELLRRIDGLISLVAEMEVLPPEERSAEHDESLQRLARRIRESRSEYEALLVRMREQDGRAAALLGGSQVRASTIRAALAPDEALIEFFVTSERLIIFALTREGTRAVERPTDVATLARRVRLARELAGSRISSGPSPVPALEALHRELLEPVLESGALEGIRALIIVPHDMLGNVPFAALRDPAGGRYAVERFALTSLPSGAVLPALRKRPGPSRGEWGASVLVPFPETLPGTEAEGNAVRRGLDDVERIDGRRATEEAARRALASGRILHVASHGILDVTNPFFSRIDLSPGRERLPENDGRLEAHELLSLRTRSPLVFLSGCETGAGQAWSSSFARGEDYATLATAFLYSGASSVVATLWRIEDKGAAAFAARFYHHLEGHTPTEALALAQRDLIRSRRYAAPYYWAGYRLSGAVQPETVSPARGDTRWELAQNRGERAFH
jgi:CHAT domain-containing protein